MNSSNIMSSTNLTGIFQTPFIHSTKTSFTQERVCSKISSCSNQLPECKCLRRNLIGASTFRGLLGIQGGTWLQLSWKLTRGNAKLWKEPNEILDLILSKRRSNQNHQHLINKERKRQSMLYFYLAFPR